MFFYGVVGWPEEVAYNVGPPLEHVLPFEFLPELVPVLRVHCGQELLVNEPVLRRESLLARIFPRIHDHRFSSLRTTLHWLGLDIRDLRGHTSAQPTA